MRRFVVETDIMHLSVTAGNSLQKLTVALVPTAVAAGRCRNGTPFRVLVAAECSSFKYLAAHLSAARSRPAGTCAEGILLGERAITITM